MKITIQKFLCTKKSNLHHQKDLDKRPVQLGVISLPMMSESPCISSQMAQILAHSDNVEDFRDHYCTV